MHSLRTITLTTLIVAALSAAPSGATAKQSSKSSGNVTFDYVGILQDENRNPIGGVYPLTFSLYASDDSSKPMWSETHWIAVDQGRYEAKLGEDSKIPKKLKLEDLYIGVGLQGSGELMRESVQPYVTTQAKPVQTVPEPPLATTQLGSRPNVSPTNSPRAKGVVEYADRAGFSFEAEHATTADRIDNTTIEDIKKSLGGPVKLGKQRKYSGQVGGEGGYEFTEVCPEGYVVIGISGAAGRYIDSFRLVCAPLEQ